MEEPNEVESSAAPTDAVPGDEVAAQSQASTATEADPYASAACESCEVSNHASIRNCHGCLLCP